MVKTVSEAERVVRQLERYRDNNRSTAERCRARGDYGTADFYEGKADAYSVAATMVSDRLVTS